MTVFLGSEYNLLIVPSSTSHKGNLVIKALIYKAKSDTKKFTNDFSDQNVYMTKQARLATFAISFVDNFCLL